MAAPSTRGLVGYLDMTGVVLSGKDPHCKGPAHHTWLGGIWAAWHGGQGHARGQHAHVSRATAFQNTSGFSVTFESPSGW